MTEPFRIGQWVRDVTFGTVLKIVGTSSPNNPAALLVEGLNGVRVLRSADMLEHWVARPGDRVRVTKCDQFPQAVGFVGLFEDHGERYFRVTENSLNGWQLLRDRTEFEPAPAPASETTTPRYTFDSKSLSADDGGDGGRFTLSDAESTVTAGIESPSRRVELNPEGLRRFREGGERLMAREALKQKQLESAKEQLGSEWKGKR